MTLHQLEQYLCKNNWVQHPTFLQYYDNSNGIRINTRKISQAIQCIAECEQSPVEGIIKQIMEGLNERDYI